jgi:hypothetical protein
MILLVQAATKTSGAPNRGRTDVRDALAPTWGARRYKDSRESGMQVSRDRIGLKGPFDKGLFDLERP